MNPPVSVDCHFHVFHAANTLVKAGQSLPGARYAPAYDAPLSAWQAATRPLGFTDGVMQGVTYGVLVQTSFMGTDNSLLLAQLAQQPTLLRGIAVVSPDADLETLSALHAQGVRGIRLNFAGRSHNMAVWQAATNLWDAVLALGWHVELHTDTGALPGVLAALPQALPMVVDHFGKPAQADLQDATVKALRQRQTNQAGAAVHIKLSAAYRLAAGVSPQTLARLWLGELGPQALLWGSDWPCTNHESQADYPALHAALSDWLGCEGDAVMAARSTNPMRLYWGVT